MKSAPSFHDWWDPAIEPYYRADVEDEPNGSVRVRIRPETINQVLAQGREEDWMKLFSGIRAPTLLITSHEPYGGPGTSPIVAREAASATAGMIAGCRWIQVPGNHATMLFGEGARQTAAAIETFVRGD